MPSYLQFHSIPSDKKTNEFDVVSRTTGATLGKVYFRPQWRKYVFEPAWNTLYDAVCLQQVAEFCTKQTEVWRERIRSRNAKAKSE